MLSGDLGLTGYCGIRHGVTFRMTLRELDMLSGDFRTQWLLWNTSWCFYTFRMTLTELDMLSGDLGLTGYCGIHHGVTFRMTLRELDMLSGDLIGLLDTGLLLLFIHVKLIKFFLRQ